MIKYTSIRVGQLGKIVTGKTPKTSIPENYGGDYMFIGPIDLHKHFIISESEKMISEKGFNSIKTNTLNGLSILVGCIGWDMGNVALVEKKCATNQQINSITNIKDDYNPFYIYYWFKGKKAFLFKISNVTRTPLLNKTDFSNIIINLPNISTQKQIAKVLSDLDTKIEVNNKINQELEAMAKLVYDYWFVQFDFPMPKDYAASIGKPELAGRPYKTSGGKMVYNAELKREIPEGWEVKYIKEIEPNVITGKTPSTKKEENFGGDIPFITIDDIRQSRFIYHTERTLTKVGADTQSTKYLEEYDICVSCIGTVGVIGFVGKKAQTNQQINTISKPKEYNRYYLFQYLQDYFDFNVAAKKGAVLSNMNKGEFELIPVIESNLKLRQLYYNKVDSNFKIIANNIRQNQKLAELRDWLLPMLMNGQVRVEKGYEEVEDVVSGPDSYREAAEDGVKYGEG